MLTENKIRADLCKYAGRGPTEDQSIGLDGMVFVGWGGGAKVFFLFFFQYTFFVTTTSI